MSSSSQGNASQQTGLSPAEYLELIGDVKDILSRLERAALLGSMPSLTENISSTLQRIQVNGPELSDTYPMNARPQLQVTFPQSSQIQIHEIPNVEDALYNLGLQRIDDYKQAVYIPPSAKPSLQAQDDTMSPLLETVMEFLAGDGQVMLILGDSGAGKSTFNRHLEYTLWQDYTAGEPIPLFINLPALDRPKKDLVREQLRLLDISEEQIRELKLQRRFVLVCDGYDESQLTCNLHTTNLLNQSGQWSAKLVVTCRTQYLGPSYRDKFEPQEGGHYNLSTQTLYQEAVITPFSKKQIEDYVERYVPLEPRTWVKKDYMDKLTVIPGLMGMVTNPFLLTLALGALPDVVQDKLDYSRIRITRLQLYDIFVKHWLGANKRRLQNVRLGQGEQRAFNELLDDGFEENGVKFQVGLAAAIFQEQDGRPVVDYNHRRDKDSWKTMYFGLEYEKSLLRSASLLSRVGNQYRFVHRSVLEYFYSCMICPSATNRYEFAPQGHIDYISVLLPIADHPLSQRLLVEEPSIVQFLAERIQLNSEFKQQLFVIIERSKTDTKAACAAANAITILIKAGVRFNGADLRGIQIPGADVSGGQFDSVQFQDANLTAVNFTNSWIRQANFSGAQMEGVQLEKPPHLKESDKVYSCAYSPNGMVFAMGLDGGSINVYSTATWSRFRTLWGHNKQVTSLAFSPDSLRLLSGSLDKTKRLWDWKAGTSNIVLAWRSGAVKAVGFSPCGEEIASVDDDKLLRLQTVQTDSSTLVLTGFIGTSCFLPSNELPSSHMRYLDSTGVFFRLLIKHGPVCCIAYSPDGQNLAISGDNEQIQLFNTQSRMFGLVFNTAGLSSVCCIAYSPDGQHIVSGHHSGNLHVWETATGESWTGWSSHPDGITDVAFSPNGQWIASSGLDNLVKLWDARTGTMVSTLTGHSSSVHCIAFSPDGLQLLSCGSDGTVRLLDTSSVATRLDSDATSAMVSSVAYSPDGRYLVASIKGGVVQQYGAATGEAGLEYLGGPGGIKSVAYSPDGLWVAAAGDGDVTIWNAVTGLVDLNLWGHTKVVNCVKFSPCGRRIVTCSDDSTVRVWDGRSGKTDHILFGHTKRVLSLALAPSGLEIVSSSHDGSIQIWKLGTEERRVFAVHSIRNDMLAVDYSLDGQKIASSYSRTAIRIRNEHDGELQQTLEHDDFVSCFAFSSCGQWMTVGCGPSVWLWRSVPNGTGSAQEWAPKAVILGSSSNVKCVAWRPSSLEFVTVSEDGSFRLWKLQLQNESDELSARMEWGVGPAVFTALDAVVGDAVGLGNINRQLLVGARCHNWVSILGC